MKKTEIENKRLLEFAKSCKYHLLVIDKLMERNESVDRGKEIAKEMNRFNFDLDAFLHFGCNVDLNNLKSVLNKSFKL
jgi:hypothetical protein